MGKCCLVKPKNEDTNQLSSFSYASYLMQHIKNLKPSKLLKQQYFQTSIKKLQRILSQQNNQIMEINLSKSEVHFFKIDTQLVIRWKLLIFCDSNNPDLYKQNYFGHQKVNEHPSYNSIMKDLDRTFIDYDEQLFIDKNQKQKINKKQILVKKLQRVLKNLCLYFPKIGYTQGINFIVGFFLVCGFQQEQAFWLFIYLSTNEKYMLIGMFEDKFPMAYIYCEVLFRLLEKYNPNLLKKVIDLDLPKQAWIIHWFLTYFVIVLPLDVCKLFWDFILIVGGIGTVYLTLAIFQQLQDDLLAINEDFEFIQYFKNLKDRQFLKKKIDFKKLLKNAYDFQISKEQFSIYVSKIKQKNIYVQFYQNLNQSKTSKEKYKNYLKKIQKQRNRYFDPTYRIKFIQRSLKTIKNKNPVFYYMLLRDQKSNTNKINKNNGLVPLSSSSATHLTIPVAKKYISNIKISMINGSSESYVQKKSVNQDSFFDNGRDDDQAFQKFISSAKS